MKKSLRLIRLASILTSKYASINAENIRPEVISSIYNAVANASKSNQNIIPFIQMAAEDQATVSFFVMRNGRNIKVFDLNVHPEDESLLPKYQPLVGQVQDYLNQNWELFPTKQNGEDVVYNNFTFKLEYPNERMGNV